MTIFLLGNNKIGDNGVKYLADALQHGTVGFRFSFSIDYFLYVGIECIGFK